MKEFNTQHTSHLAGSKVFTLDMGETTRFAAQYQEYDVPTWDDWCSGTAVIDVEALEVVDSESTIDRDNPNDLKALAIAERIIEAYKSQEDDYRADSEWKELWEIAGLIGNRAEQDITAVHENYGMWSTSHELEHARYILVNSSHDGHGRVFCAKTNNYAYKICDVPTKRVEQWINDGWGDITDFDFSSEAEDEVYGVVFNNLDVYGDSTPTEQELEGIL